MIKLSDEKKQKIKDNLFFIKALIFTYIMFLLKKGRFAEFYWFFPVYFYIVLHPAWWRFEIWIEHLFFGKLKYYYPEKSDYTYSENYPSSNYTPVYRRRRKSYSSSYGENDEPKPDYTWSVEDYIDNGRDVEEYFDQ